jgi:hypothetical protein
VIDLALLVELRDLLARVVRVQEALEDGDAPFAFEIARGLECDLAGLIDRLGEGPR